MSAATKRRIRRLALAGGIVVTAGAAYIVGLNVWVIATDKFRRRAFP